MLVNLHVSCLQSVIDECGLDPTRLHILYKAPPSEVLEWENSSIVGMQRWLAKVLKLSQSVPSTVDNMPSLDAMSTAERDMYRFTNQTIKQVTDCLTSSYSFNTAISDLIKLSNHISTATKDIPPTSAVYQHAVLSLVKMMAPMTPTVSEECWESANQTQSVFDQSWPEFYTEALEKDDLECVIQVKSLNKTVTKKQALNFLNRSMVRLE